MSGKIAGDNKFAVSRPEGMEYAVNKAGKNKRNACLDTIILNLMMTITMR